TRWAVGQAILDHEPHGQVHHAVGVLTAGWCEIGEVRVEVLVTFRTVMLRIRDDKITRTPHVEIAQIVQRPMGLLVPIGRVTTTRTRLTRVVATVQDDLGLRQVCKRCNTFGRVGAIRTWTEHRVALLAQRLGPELYDQGLLGATRYPRYSLERGQIFVGPETYQLTRTVFRYKPLAPMTVKGKTAPVQVYQVLGLWETSDSYNTHAAG